MYYNVTFSRVREIIFAEGKGNVLHNLYVSLYPYVHIMACVCVCYTVICGLSGSTLFFPIVS